MLFIGAGMNKIYIEELNIKSFGKFQDKKIKLSPSFNLVYGLNESGKTTIKNFIEGMFYGFDEGKARINFSNKREIYRPKSSYIYAGELKIIKSGEPYIFYRDFDSGEYKVTDVNKGREIDLKKSDLNAPGKFFLGVDYDIYKAYISSEKIKKISTNSRKKVLEKLSSSDIDYNFSIKNSLEILDNRLKEIGTDRAYTRPYYKTKEKIKNLDEKLRQIDKVKIDFYTSYKKLENLKDDLDKKENIYQEKRRLNQFYNKKRSDENFKSYRKRSDRLFEIDKELEAYNDLKGLVLDDFNDNYKDKNSQMILYILPIIIITFVAVIVSRYYILLFSLPFFYLLLRNFTNDGGNNSSEYNNLRRRFLKYESLINEREKIVEVLEILKKQDLTLFENDEEISFDFNSYDNLKELEELSSLEGEIKDLSLEIHTLEKSIVSTDNILQNEAGLRDDLKYQIDKLNYLEDEKKAINIAKETILEIAKENRADINKINKKVQRILSDTSKSELDINVDSSLSTEIKDKSLFSYSEDQLSKGFFDQVNLAIKLSILDEIINGSFLIFDDAFINYDIKRLIRFLYLVLDEATDRQIIYFTCHKREEEFFETENIFINKIKLEDR